MAHPVYRVGGPFCKFNSDHGGSRAQRAPPAIDHFFRLTNLIHPRSQRERVESEDNNTI